jgi:ankyrin repeat protein
MAALHIAIQLKCDEIIELLLQCERTNPNILSPLHGAPLHLACLSDSVRTVQILLLNNAERSLGLRNGRQKLPREMTKNQRIIYLLEKYEKRS